MTDREKAMDLSNPSPELTTEQKWEQVQAYAPEAWAFYERVTTGDLNDWWQDKPLQLFVRSILYIGTVKAAMVKLLAERDRDKARIAELEKERDKSVLVREYAHRMTAAAARNKALDEAARIVDAKSQQYADEAHDMKIWGNKVAETAARVGSRALKAASAAIRAALKDGTDAETPAP